MISVAVAAETVQYPLGRGTAAIWGRCQQEHSAQVRFSSAVGCPIESFGTEHDTVGNESACRVEIIESPGPWAAWNSRRFQRKNRARLPDAVVTGATVEHAAGADHHTVGIIPILAAREAIQGS